MQRSIETVGNHSSSSMHLERRYEICRLRRTDDKNLATEL